MSAYEENKLTDLPKMIRPILNSILYPNDLHLKTEKTVYLSKKYKRTITAIIITSENALSIGRERKREIRTLIHLRQQNKLSAEEKQNLSYFKGSAAFALSVELNLWKRLDNKYGKSIMNNLKNLIFGSYLKAAR